MLGEKRNDTWIYEDKRMQRTSKIAQNSRFIPAKACGLQEDVILLWRRRRHHDDEIYRSHLRSTRQHTQVVVDKVVVVVLKFPNYGLLVKAIKKFPKSPFRPAGRVVTFDGQQICSAITALFTNMRTPKFKSRLHNCIFRCRQS